MTISYDASENMAEGECGDSPMRECNERMPEDIGDTDITKRDMTGDLGSDQKKVFRDIQRVIGNTQVD